MVICPSSKALHRAHAGQSLEGYLAHFKVCARGIFEYVDVIDEVLDESTEKMEKY